MARRRKRNVRDEKPAEPPMTPMIDVIFQLLIFFVLTMKFKETEGRLLSQLPKDKGMAPSSVTQPELQEVRIVLCIASDEREQGQHTTNKGRHEANLEHDEQADLESTKSEHAEKGKSITDRPHIVVNDVCHAWIDTRNNMMGKLYKTWVCPKGHTEDPLPATKRAAENVARYKEIAAKARELYDLTPSTQDPTKRAPIILDTDSAVPYEHIVGVVNALKELGLENVEFVANARHDQYYGSGQKGQFNTYREQKQRK
jgi:biopolymer transport protein ExbD